MSLADQGPFADYLRTVVEALPHPSPFYCLIGALAVNAWGRVRSTRDIDLLVLSQEPARTELIDSFNSRGFQLDMTWMERNPMAKNRVRRFSHPSYPDIPLDLMLSADSHEESALARRQTLNLLGVRVWVCSPEDLILMKLKAGRPHDFEDVLSVIKNPRLQLDLTIYGAGLTGSVCKENCSTFSKRRADKLVGERTPNGRGVMNEKSFQHFLRGLLGMEATQVPGNFLRIFSRSATATNVASARSMGRSVLLVPSTRNSGGTLPP